MPDHIPASIETPGQSSWWDRNKTIVWALAAAAVGVSLLVLLVYALTSNPQAAATWRDVTIISLSCISLGIGIALVVLIYYLVQLIRLLRDEIKPLLESANQTMDTLRGTSAFMSENLVRPTIQASSTLAGARRILEVMLGLRSNPKR